MIYVYDFLHILSVAGGGGSDAGYSGGSSYSSSSGSDYSGSGGDDGKALLLGLLGGGGIALGIFGTAYIRDKIKGTAGLWVSGVLSAAICAGTIAYSIANSTSWLFSVTFALCVLIGWWIEAYAFASSRKKSAASSSLDKASAAGSSQQQPENNAAELFNNESLKTAVDTLFQRFQSEWSANDSSNFATYMTAAFARRNTLLLKAIIELGRKNEVKEPRAVVTIQLTRGKTETDPARVTAQVRATALDTLIEQPSGKTLYQNHIQFTEYWTLVRDADEWRIDSIDQSTADASAEQKSLREFANQQSMHYSLDMGWLLLPRRGRLFGDGAFGKSDINNHVIGEWNGQLVQLYTYRAYGADNGATSVIGQINLPKSYGGIIVQPKRSFAQRLTHSNVPPKGYKKYSFEWEHFNNRYEVYATDADQLATFELINPKFMVDLYDADKKVCIEVIDSVVYIYKQINGEPASRDLYIHMMTLLQSARKELHL